MSDSIDVGLLRKNLKKAKIRRDFPEVKRKDPPKEEAEHLKYAIDNILNPLLNDEMIHTADLDFDKLDREQLEDLQNYYYNYFHDRTYEWETLKKVFKICDSAPPKALSVNFI